MLGETFEFVNDRMRILYEKVNHIPEQIEVFHVETDDYTQNSNNTAMKPGFRLFGGKGMLEIHHKSATNIYLKKHKENIYINKPIILAKNLIWGGLYIDVEGLVNGYCPETGCRVELKFY